MSAAEHVVRVLVSRYGNRGWCQTCGWDGPRRETRREAGIDATAHAAWMARRGER